MKLNKEQLEIVSECILTKMRVLSEIKPVSNALAVAIQAELVELQSLNSLVCDELQKIQDESNNTE